MQQRTNKAIESRRESGIIGTEASLLKGLLHSDVQGAAEYGTISASDSIIRLSDV
jgi:hypothetical protein